MESVNFKRDGWTLKVAKRFDGTVYVFCLRADHGDLEEGTIEAGHLSLHLRGEKCKNVHAALDLMRVTSKEICDAYPATPGEL